MSKKRKKDISIGFALKKDAGARLRAQGLQALDASQVIVKSGNKLIGSGAGGYESRIWEKVTCNISDPLIDIIDPDPILSNPERFGITVNATQTPAAKLSSRKTAK